MVVRDCCVPRQCVSLVCGDGCGYCFPPFVAVAAVVVSCATGTPTSGAWPAKRPVRHRFDRLRLVVVVVSPPCPADLDSQFWNASTIHPPSHSYCLRLPNCKNRQRGPRSGQRDPRGRSGGRDRRDGWSVVPAVAVVVVVVATTTTTTTILPGMGGGWHYY